MALTPPETLRRVLEPNSTRQLMESVTDIDAECAELLAKADSLHREYVTLAEAIAIRDAERKLAGIMESAVTVRDMVEARPDFHKAAKSQGLHPEAWTPNLNAYVTGREDVQACIEDAIAALKA